MKVRNPRGASLVGLVVNLAVVSLGTGALMTVAVIAVIKAPILLVVPVAGVALLAFLYWANR